MGWSARPAVHTAPRHSAEPNLGVQMTGDSAKNLLFVALSFCRNLDNCCSVGLQKTLFWSSPCQLAPLY